MKAVICEKYEDLEQLKFGEVAAPVPGAGEVRVDIDAVGVNFPDALLVQGAYQLKPDLPFIVGCEFMGRVSALGAVVSQWQVGDRVMGFVDYGAFAETVVAPMQQLVTVPDFVSDTQAAGILCSHGTAHHALKQRARLTAGETLLVLGAAGATGLAAVQIGKAMGARVIAACSTAEKLQVARDSGADETINYSEEQLGKAIKVLTAGLGVDVVFDPLGGEAFIACSRVMARNGRLLVVGFATGTIPSLPVNLALVKEYSVVGVFFGSFARHEPVKFKENMEELFSWYREGRVAVNVDAILPLADAGVALRKIMARQVTGKIVLTV